MAECYTNLPPKVPGRIAEHELAQQLIALRDPRLHLWFALDSIPDVRDVDILIWHEDAGVFVIEVKGVHLNGIRSFGFKQWQVQGRPPQRSPQNQAHEAMLSLLNYLRRSIRPPFLIPSVCWPRISRRAWNVRWSDPAITGDFSDRMIFQEDLASADRLVARLVRIRERPPIRAGSRRPFRHSQDQFLDFMRRIEQLLRDIPPYSIAPVSIIVLCFRFLRRSSDSGIGFSFSALESGQGRRTTNLGYLQLPSEFDPTFIGGVKAFLRDEFHRLAGPGFQIVANIDSGDPPDEQWFGFVQQLLFGSLPSESLMHVGDLTVDVQLPLYVEGARQRGQSELVIPEKIVQVWRAENVEPFTNCGPLSFDQIESVAEADWMSMDLLSRIVEDAEPVGPEA